MRLSLTKQNLGHREKTDFLLLIILNRVMSFLTSSLNNGIQVPQGMCVFCVPVWQPWAMWCAGFCCLPHSQPSSSPGLSSCRDFLAPFLSFVEAMSQLRGGPGRGRKDNDRELSFKDQSLSCFYKSNLNVNIQSLYGMGVAFRFLSILDSNRILFIVYKAKTWYADHD